jgi:uridine phosphorylase
MIEWGHAVRCARPELAVGTIRRLHVSRTRLNAASAGSKADTPSTTDAEQAPRKQRSTFIHDGWACYHTELYVFRHDGHDYGIVGRAVGAAFAVLVAEELFASGCRLLISITSAGQIAPVQAPPYFVVINRALRDEGTSYHYLPASEYSEADVDLTKLAHSALSAAGTSVHVGASWTTDAPFRETERAIAAALHAGIIAVEMEAAALYAFAKARSRFVLCFAHVTNQMGQVDKDFEKGFSEGAEASLHVIFLTADRWRNAS